MRPPIFSDRDIEEYIEGVFEGDRASIKEYLEQTVEGQARLASIKALYAALKEEPVPQLSFSLDQAVLDKIASRETKQRFNWNSMVWVVGAIAGLALLFYSTKFLNEISFTGNTNQAGLLVPIALFMALAIFAFQWVDIYGMKKRYDVTER